MQLWLEIRSSARDALIQLRCPIEEEREKRAVWLCICMMYLPSCQTMLPCVSESQIPIPKSPFLVFSPSGVLDIHAKETDTFAHSYVKIDTGFCTVVVWNGNLPLEGCVSPQSRSREKDGCEKGSLIDEGCCIFGSMEAKRRHVRMHSLTTAAFRPKRVFDGSLLQGSSTRHGVDS